MDGREQLPQLGEVRTPDAAILLDPLGWLNQKSVSSVCVRDAVRHSETPTRADHRSTPW